MLQTPDFISTMDVCSVWLVQLSGEKDVQFLGGSFAGCHCGMSCDLPQEFGWFGGDVGWFTFLLVEIRTLCF